MAGLAGFTAEAAGDAEPTAVLRAMSALLIHLPSHAQDPPWSDGRVYAARSHNGVLPGPAQPVSRDGIYVWLDGFFNNRAELARAAGTSAPASEAELLLDLYRRNGDHDALSQIDGFYAAALYDTGKRLVHLISDHHGLRALYWTVHRHGLVWGSEVKVVLALPGFVARIDPHTAEQYAHVGYPPDDRTWFADVTLLAPGSVLSWDLDARRPRSARYWWWDEIRLRAEPIDPTEAAEEAGRLFIEAVEQQCPEARVNVELSGGLDSRAILAAIPAGKEVHAYTSGQAECDDIRIARRVAALRGATHHVYEIDGRNWLDDNAIADVWRQDGLSSLMQLVGSRAHGPCLSEAPVRLNGAAGEGVLRGRYLTRALLDRPVTEAAVAAFIKYPGFRLGQTPYSELAKADPYFFYHRVLRYIFGTIRSTLAYGEVRTPFLANALMEFVYSLPDSLRFEGKLYRDMLMMYFPNYYRTIPWQKTGEPFAPPSNVDHIRRLPGKTRRVFWQYARKVGLTQYVNNNPRHTILDRPLWLRQEPARSFVESVLTHPDAIYPAYFSRNQVLDHWERHQRGEDFANRLCHYLTAEIWFQQVFTGRYRPLVAEPEAAPE